MVRCTATLSSRACIQTSSAATRYSASASSSVRPTAPKSTPLAGHHVHAGQQVGERVVATGAGRRDGLLLGETGGQLAADHAVEQQVGGVPEDARADDADRDAADAQQDHRRGQRRAAGSAV